MSFLELNRAFPFSFERTLFFLLDVLCKSINEFSFISCVVEVLLIGITLGHFLGIFPDMHSYITVTN